MNLFVRAATVLIVGTLTACQSFSPSSLPEPTAGASTDRYKVVVAEPFNVREGSVSFPLGWGSGLEFAGLQNGEAVYWGITDRGPNLDGPNVGALTSKLFPAPSFHPALVEVRAKDQEVRVTKVIPLKKDGRLITGLPRPATAVGFSQEVALSPGLQDLGSDEAGLDTEAVRLDPTRPGYAWISDEYGPFVAQVELATGAIVKTLAPGSGLPAVLAKRQPNRGMEGLAITPRGILVGALQSILDVDGQVKKSTAAFTRLVRINPATGETAQFAYPVDGEAYKKTADAKIGDVVALSETEFLILEQGTGKTGPRNLVYKISLSGATDLTGMQTPEGKELETKGTVADLQRAGIALVSKTLITDLRDWGWSAEKAEGLAVLDQRRFAVVSDNDFGLATTVANPAPAADGKLVTDPTAYSLQGGELTLEGKPTGAQLTAGTNGQPTAFWVFTTLKPFF